MASIDARTTPSGEPRWNVRYRDTNGRDRMKTFRKVSEAKKFKAQIEADLSRGQFVDPTAGKTLLRDWINQFLRNHDADPATIYAMEKRFDLHVLPQLGHYELRALRASTIRSWMGSLPDLSASYRRVIFANLSTALKAAVDDELIGRNPCAIVKGPKVPTRKVIPWTAEQVVGVRSALPDRYGVLVTIAAGLGLRQGEAFGLSPDDIDWLRGKVEVRRQVKLWANNRQTFALPKGGKTRTVPLPETVKDALAAYLVQFPAQPVTLPWSITTGKPTTVKLMVSTRERGAINRNHFNGYTWKPALVEAGIDPSRDNGMHALRHYFASVLLDAGESIKAVSEYLGHGDPAFTLKTYTHLMPSSENRTKTAIDRALSAIPQKCVTDVGSGAP